MNRTGWNCRDFLKTGIQVAGVAGIGNRLRRRTRTRTGKVATATGFGTVGVHSGKPFLEVTSGTIAYDKIRYVAA